MNEKISAGDIILEKMKKILIVIILGAVIWTLVPLF